jgi:hypothetical protein
MELKKQLNGDLHTKRHTTHNLKLFIFIKNLCFKKLFILPHSRPTRKKTEIKAVRKFSLYAVLCVDDDGDERQQEQQQQQLKENIIIICERKGKI